MDALFFDGAAGPLFGLLSPAEPTFDMPPDGAAAPAGSALVVCAPFGEEGIIAHMALRQLAVQGARCGFDVLRFDYFGTGDSAGADADFSLAQARRDTERAVREVMELTGAVRVGLVGLRLGAAVAASAARDLAPVHSLALWDPVVDGRDLVEGMASDRARLSPVEDGADIDPGRAPFGYDGFPVTPALYRELAAIDTLGAMAELTIPAYLCHSPDPEAEQLARHLPDGHCARIDSRRLWNRAPDAATPPVSTAAIETILRWLAQAPV